MDVLINNNTHRAISVQSSKILGNTDEFGVMLSIKTKQFQDKVLNFFVIIMIYWVMDQNKAISEQSSVFLCNTDG